MIRLANAPNIQSRTPREDDDPRSCIPSIELSCILYLRRRKITRLAGKTEFVANPVFPAPKSLKTNMDYLYVKSTYITIFTS